MLRLALVQGCPQKAGRYAAAARRLRDVRFTGLVQPEAIKRQEASRLLGVTIAVETLEELLSSQAEEIDGVIIHGSVAKRAELACRAAAAGKHVFVSSPLAATIEEVDRIAAACRAANVVLTVGSHIRFRPSVAEVKSALSSGKLGDPGLLRVHCWEPKDDGEIRSKVIQQLDLALWMFPQSPTEVFALGRDQKKDEGCWPDYLQIHLGFPQGGMALISISRSLPPGDDYQTVSLIGSRGAAYADDHLQKHLVFHGAHPRAVQRDEMVPALVAQLRDFADAVATRRDPAVAANGMKSAMKLADAVWKSLTEHQPVSCEGVK